MGIDTNRNLSDAALTAAVVASFAGSGSPRFKQIAESLVVHLHAFVADIEPTEDEWLAAIDFLTRCGDITDDRRQEFVLLSDVLGVSMEVIEINHRAPSGATESTVFGPFFVKGSPGFENGDDIAAGAPGQPCHISGHVRSTGGQPLAGARIEVWQADEDGFYDVQYDGGEVRGRGHLSAGEDGRFSFWSVLPEAYPIPDDGPVGDLLKAGGRSPMRPAHVHFMIEADGHARLITHVFAAGDEHLGSDAVFGVKDTLIAEFERHEPGDGPDGRTLDSPWYSMTYDFVLAPRHAGGET
jgi:hydroxyquinol 1,2-dioxygenase